LLRGVRINVSGRAVYGVGFAVARMLR